MTLIGDALNKAGVQIASAISTDDKVKITIETKIAYMKKHIDNIDRLVGKYYNIKDDAQEEMDVVSALNNHFMYMVEAFKDILENVSKSDQRNAVMGLRESVRYFAKIKSEVKLDCNLDDALATFMDRNDVAHKYEIYEAVSQKTLQNCISYGKEYMEICRVLYQFCKEHQLIE